MEKFTYLAYAEVNTVAKDNINKIEKVAILKLYKLIFWLISINIGYTMSFDRSRCQRLTKPNEILTSRIP